MKIKDFIKDGIRRVYDPRCAEKNCYIKLPKMINGRYGPWCELFSDETQKFMGIETPQKFLMSSLKFGDQSECEEYKGPISVEDKGDD